MERPFCSDPFRGRLGMCGSDFPSNVYRMASAMLPPVEVPVEVPTIRLWLRRARFWQSDAHVGDGEMLRQVLAVRRHQARNPLAADDQLLQHDARHRMDVT